MNDTPKIPDNGPRVTFAMISDEIEKEDYYVFPGTTLTVCLLTLKNGYTVLGKSACADPTNFDENVGRHYAREDAIRDIWPLLGFRLRDQLSAA